MEIIRKPRYWVLILFLAMTIVYIHLPEGTQAEEREDLLNQIPLTMNGWKMTRQYDMSPEEMASLGAAEYVLRSYQRGNDEVLLYAAFFTGKHGSLTHNPEKCYPGTGFTVLGKEQLLCQSAQGEPFPAIRIVPVKEYEKLVVLYWFQEGDEVIVNKLEHIAKVLTRAILYNRTESLMVRLSTDFTTEEELTQRTEILQEFADIVRMEIARVKMKDA